MSLSTAGQPPESVALMNPRVSVIIPVRNGERTLARAIDSALSQTYAGRFEVIVIDNGSIDGTRQVIESYGDRVVAIKEPMPGLPRALNRGAALSRGEYFAFLDADDEWMLEKLAHIMPPFEATPQCVLAYHDAVEVDLVGRVQRDSYYYNGYSPPRFDELLTPEGHICHILPTAVVMRRSAFQL